MKISEPRELNVFAAFERNSDRLEKRVHERLGVLGEVIGGQRILFEEGAGVVSVILRGEGAEIDAGDGDYNTPLNFAARDDRLEVARALLELGANPNLTTDRGSRVLDFAGGEEMRRLLRRYGGSGKRFR